MTTGDQLLLLRPLIKPDPVEWIETVDLSQDPSSDSDDLVKLDYYQVEPITAQFDARVRQVTIMAPEQTGKSFCWRMPVLYKIRWEPGTFWIVYESDEKAEDINKETLHPLLEAVPEIAAMLNRNTFANRRYQLPNGAIVDFTGAGAAITSKAKRDGVADEIDTWPMPDKGKRANLANFKKRFRVAWRQGRGCLVKCSSPKGENSVIGDEWDDTDRGRWHLCCQGCGKLTIPSHRADLVQWERDGKKRPIEKSIRIICPACKYEHRESAAVKMNRQGGYVAERPEIKDRRGFQWGALACPRVFSWMEFAEAAQERGLDKRMHFDNSLRGVPYVPRKATRAEIDQLKAHEGPGPDLDTLCGALFASDTQAKGWYWVTAAVDMNKDLWIPPGGYGLAVSEYDLGEAWDARRYGLLPVLGIIDEGGHRLDEVLAFIEDRTGLFTFKGNSKIGVDWKESKESHRRLLANPHTWRYRTLHRLYRAEPADGMWIHFPAGKMTDDIYDQLSWSPNDKVRNGHRLENWLPADDSNDHYTDCLKMLECLLDVAKEKLPAANWKRVAPWMRGPGCRPRKARR